MKQIGTQKCSHEDLQEKHKNKMFLFGPEFLLR